MRGLLIRLVCGEDVISEHGNGGKYHGWSNPIDVIPPIGSIIKYTTFNQGYKEGQGVVTEYVVDGYVFTTEEDYNSCYRNKYCDILVSKFETE